MNITQVRYVMAIAKAGNFSKAAEHLFITQPALSLQITALEKELGLHLFHRTSKGVFLTDDGEAFCHFSQPLMRAWENLQKNMDLRRTHPSGRLRIGLGARAYANGLFEPIVKFFDSHPEIEVTFVTDISTNVLDALAENHLDVALDRVPPASLWGNRSDFFSCDLIEERQCALLSPSDPRSSYEEISFKELCGLPIVTGPENSLEEKILQKKCADYNVSLSKFYRSDNVSIIMDLVRTGKGFTFGPASFGKHYRVAAVPMVPEDYESLCFICLRQNSAMPKLVLLRDFLVKRCGRGE